ncbi:MAG: response regulator [Deltaproteobacteria bacterium]|nr:response regulator [Deltaproteobacteria bacterium]
MATILIIDDDEQILKVCRTLLEREGFTVVESQEGSQGIEICRRRSIDLVITDIIMPGKEGLETIMELRNEFPALPIVAMSGGGQLGPESYLPLARMLGAQQALRKPFTKNELMESISGLIGSN